MMRKAIVPILIALGFGTACRAHVRAGSVRAGARVADTGQQQPAQQQQPTQQEQPTQQPAR